MQRHHPRAAQHYQAPQESNGMRGTESDFEAFYSDRLELDQHRLGFAQCQRIRAFLTDSAHYLGVSVAGDEGQQQCRGGAALALEDARLNAELRGC
jgi:hypothetical protein